MKTTSLLFPLLTAAYVSAHGFLSTVTINGKAFSGNIPSGKTAPSIIRQVSTQNPNKGAQNPALTCGPDATAGSLVADANPGDALTFDWRAADLSKVRPTEVLFFFLRSILMIVGIIFSGLITPDPC